MNDLNKSNNKSLIVLILLTLVVVVWALVVAGWIKSSADSFSLFKKDSSPVSAETQIEEKQITEEFVPEETQPADEAIPTEIQPAEEPEPLETPEQTTAPQALDPSGIWDMTFRRYYSYEYEGVWESIGTEEVFLWMEIYPGQQFECDIMPYEGYINGESYGDYLAIVPQLYTGEIVGNTLRLYLDLDNFYLDYSVEVSDTIQPAYIEIPLSTEGALPSGQYDYTWVAAVDGYNLQSRVTIDLSKR